MLSRAAVIIMQHLISILKLLKNNSFVIIGPMSGFLVILILAKLSDLEADKIYFLVLSLLAFSSLVDGGISYKLSVESSNDEISEVVKKVVRNLQIFGLVPPIFLAFMLFNETNTLESPIELFTILLMAGIASIIKVLGDSLRVIGMKSTRRNTVDRASSVLSLVRVIFAYLFVNYLPFLYTYTALILVELMLFSYLLRDKVTIGSSRILLGGSVFKFHFNSAYLLANIGYILGFNIDRLISFNYLNDFNYKALIIVMSLLNMSVLPNKLVENLRTFPINNSYAKDSHRVLEYIFPALGIILFCIGLFTFNEQLSRGEKIVLSALSVIWVPVTIYYNNLWASHLKSGGSIDFAKITLLSGLFATIMAIFFSALYQLLIPIGLFSYSLINAVLVYRLRKR